MRPLLFACILMASGAFVRSVTTTVAPPANLKHMGHGHSQEGTVDCDSSEEESDDEALKRHEIVKAQARAAAHARMVALGLKPKPTLTPRPAVEVEKQAQARAAGERQRIAVVEARTAQRDGESLSITPVKDYLTREKRQEDDDEEEDEFSKLIERPEPCDFGTGEELRACGWVNTPNITAARSIPWVASRGDDALFRGGPRTDHTENNGAGGYIYFETSREPPRQPPILPGGVTTESNNIDVGGGAAAGSVSGVAQPDEPVNDFESAVLATRNISATGPQGFCISFFYAIEGLSVDRLRVIVMDVNTFENITVWESDDNFDGKWQKGEVAYTYGWPHQIWFEGIPKRAKDPSRRFRGYVALDDIVFDKMEEAGDNCLGHCTFEGGFCGWTNADTGDDFNWDQGRGSQSFLTGPQRDYSSFGKDEKTGGYIYIDSQYPRRPQDKAQLISPTLKATGVNNPICMRFATHMFGNGVGTLRVLTRIEGSEEPPKTLWEMTGEATNQWYLAQLQVASTEPIQLVLEATVGANSLGNIAIDNISFRQGTCPISPQTAARNSGDCNFEEDTCGWMNPHPADGYDDFDWARQYSYGLNGPPLDHTRKRADGYFMNLMSNTALPARGGSKAWLISPKFSTDAAPRCMAFYYYMFERTIDPSGPSLGSLRVHVLHHPLDGTKKPLTTIWRLNNHQGHRWLMARSPIRMPDGLPVSEPYQVVIEGIWGHGRVGYVAVDDISFFDGDCTTFPEKAAAVPGECSFERDMCGWQNATGILSKEQAAAQALQLSKQIVQIRPSNLIGRGGISPRASLTWRLASTVSRPANLQDHTYRAPTGYIFFDIFNQNSVQNPILRSTVVQSIDSEPDRCVSFWFAPFGRGESSTLTLFRIEPEITEEDTRMILWKFTSRRSDTIRPDWRYGQVKILADKPFRIQFEGEANDGGFALDDITFYNGDCETRPATAVVLPAEPV
ncbi:MAM and LDL-receptor class A domain-containing protein 1-like isoform X1 [Varroa destructor]|uniref:MAM domain-containing protein n=1 Tax=Varroa destructor TaxID=109461 RepID=A0A7M7JFR6_VARDE|nr:MAM and LDL-receptor class A domain-containing protein 1-like isoform X1 [Varroa destructor]XP_022647155.1 MAM and LDL-receptor class A domain-containing protein 1-like isoform X1 [Varroa destructor]XP_022647156.1 MAM and LDL-receptor class A domain-containing protein 1-like isoform X1 [Varroa destructor]